MLLGERMDSSLHYSSLPFFHERYIERRDRWSLASIHDREVSSFDSTLKFFAREGEATTRHDSEYNGCLWDIASNKENIDDRGETDYRREQICGAYLPRFYVPYEAVRENLSNFIQTTNCLSRDFVPILRNNYPPKDFVKEYSKDPDGIPVTVAFLKSSILSPSTCEEDNKRPWYYSIAYDSRFFLDPQDPFRSLCMILGHTVCYHAHYCAIFGYGSNRGPVYDNASFWNIKPHPRDNGTRVIIPLLCDGTGWQAFKEEHFMSQGSYMVSTYRRYSRRHPVKVMKWDPLDFDPMFDSNVGMKYEKTTKSLDYARMFQILRSDPPHVKHYDIDLWRTKIF